MLNFQTEFEKTAWRKSQKQKENQDKTHVGITDFISQIQEWTASPGQLAKTKCFSR